MSPKLGSIHMRLKITAVAGADFYSNCADWKSEVINQQDVSMSSFYLGETIGMGTPILLPSGRYISFNSQAEVAAPPASWHAGSFVNNMVLWFHNVDLPINFNLPFLWGDFSANENVFGYDYGAQLPDYAGHDFNGWVNEGPISGFGIYAAATADIVIGRMSEANANTTPTGVPEPATMLLLGLGLVGLAGVRRKFKE